MLHYPHIDPIAFSLGPLKVHWYGLMYLCGFAVSWLLAHHRAKKPWTPINSLQVDDLIFYCALGVILGGRLGYVLFYNLPEYWHMPWRIFEVWDGGMSFHGGLIGVMTACIYYARCIQVSWIDLTDFIAPFVPIGLGLGRIGNFINGELWGRVTTVPWGMIYPQAGPLPRHPSEIYEFLLEGVFLFIVLWCYSRKMRPRMMTSAYFLIGYGCVRFFCEFFRQPDPQLGFIAFNWMTMGQLLCVPMILGGITLIYLSPLKKQAL